MEGDGPAYRAHRPGPARAHGDGGSLAVALSSAATSRPSAWGWRGRGGADWRNENVQPERMGMEGLEQEGAASPQGPARAHGDGGNPYEIVILLDVERLFEKLNSLAVGSDGTVSSVPMPCLVAGAKIPKCRKWLGV